MKPLALAPLALALVLLPACASSDDADIDVGTGTGTGTGEPIGTVRQPLVTTVVEAESATGAGVVENDAAASGSQLRAFSTPYTGATSPFSIPGPLLSARVRVKGGGCSPMIRVAVDGVSLGQPFAVPSASWTEVSLPIAGSIGPGDHVVEIYYRWGTPGCVLRVDNVTFNSDDPPPPPPPTYTHVVEAESATGTGVVENDPSASGGQLRYFTTPLATASTTLTSGAVLSGTLRVKGAACGPRVSLFIDGQSVLSQVVTQATWTDLPFLIPSSFSGNHTIGFMYRNGPPGCGARIDQVTLTTY